MSEKIFKVRYYGIQSFNTIKVYVNNGEITRIHKSIIGKNPYWNSIDSTEYIYTISDSDFEEKVKSFIKELWKTNQKKYNEFVELLNNETIEKYFYTALIPKD